MAEYYIIENGTHAGPYTVEQLVERRLPLTELVWTPGMQEWQPAETIAELRMALTCGGEQVPPPPGGYGFRQAPGNQTQQPPYNAAPQQPYNQGQQPYNAPEQPQPTYAPGYQPMDNGAGTPPPTYLVWAILSTICCCIPFGIVAIVYSTRIDGLWQSGRYAEAWKSSRYARNWTIAAAVGGVLSNILMFVINFTYGFFDALTQ